MEKIFNTAKKNRLYCLYSFLFIFFLMSSFLFYYGKGFVNVLNLLGLLAIALLAAPLLNMGFVWLSRLSYHGRAVKKARFVPLLYFFIMLIAQIPVYLAFYPGFIYYDIGTQIEQYDTRSFVTNHPLLHTLFMGFFKNLFEDANKGYALATFLQLIIVDICIAYVLSQLRNKCKSRLLPLLLAAFYGLNPLCSLLSISSTKDVIFSALLAVTVMDLIRLCKGEANRFVLPRMVLTGVLMLLMRSNAVYAFIPALIITLICYRKDKRILLHLGIYTACVLLLTCASDKLLIRALDANSGSVKEMMSIPSQIMARIYLESDDEECRETVLKYIPEPEKYNYYISDPIKEQLDFDTIDSQCKHFLLDCALCSLKHPLIAIDAVFYNTQGYWDLFHSPYQEEHHYLIRYDGYRGGAYLDSKNLPLLYKLCEHFMLMDYEPYNLLACFAQLGIYSWLTLFAFFKALKDKNRQLYGSCLLMVFYMFTLLLGPSAIVRYGLGFVYMAPVLIMFVHHRVR